MLLLYDSKDRSTAAEDIFSQSNECAKLVSRTISEEGALSAERRPEHCI